MIQQRQTGGVRVGAIDDPLEREADRIAARVVSTAPSEHRSASVQRTSGDNDLRGSFEAGHEIEGELQSNKGGGYVLPAHLRREIEPKMGADFSKVRVHSDAASDRLNRSLGAQAFTYGADIYMGAGKYEPASNKGKHLLTHELAHVMQQGGGIQRYPANSLSSSANINWQAETAGVLHPGEGISGGVYIFTGVGGPVNKLVVKPEFVEGENEQARNKDTISTKAHTTFASSLLSKVGIRTPTSRIVEEGSAEQNNIIAASHTHGAAIPVQVPIDEFTTRHLSYLSVMGEVNARSMGRAASGVQDVGDTNDLISRLNRTALMHQVGEMIAVDAFMDNPDRIIADAANMGNIMFADNVATAIDSNSSFREIKLRVDNNPFVMRSLLALYTQRAALIDSFFNGIELAIADPDARAHFANYRVVMANEYAAWRQAIHVGITGGIAKIKALLANKTKRTELKGEAKGWQGIGAAKTSWEGFRMSEKYFNLLDSGEDPQEARRKLEEYRLYRETRKKRVKGFKWTAHFFKKKVAAQPVNG